jgi:translocation and assembly module TamB
MRRRVPAVLVTILLALLALPLMLIGAALVTFNTPQGRYVLEVATEWVSGGTVRLEALSGRFPDRLRLHRLSIRDAHGAWLIAQDIALDWSPLELLQGRARVERLTATRIEMQRSPYYPVRHAHRSQPTGPFELPFTVQLDRLTLPRVDLGAALAGSATVLRIDGGGSFRSLRQAALELQAQPLDHGSSAYRLSLQSSEAHVQGRLDLQENANGPLTNLIGLPGLGALSVHLDVLGPANALATALDARAGPMRAQAHGTLDLTAVAATLSMSIEAPAMTPRAGLSWRRISIQLQSQGPLIAPSTHGEVALEGLAVGPLELDSLRAALSGQGKALALDATVMGLRLPGPMQSMFAHAPVRLQGQALMVSANGFDIDLTLEHPLLRAQAHYELGSPGSSVQPPSAPRPRTAKGTPAATPEQRNGGTLLATIPELGPWAELAHLNLQGRGSVAASLAVNKEATRVTVSTDLQPRGGDALWTQLLGARAEFGGAMSFRGEQIQLERAQLSSPFLSASVHGSKQGKRLDVVWQAAVSSLARLSSALRGSLSGQGRVQGALPRLSASADLSADFALHDQRGLLHARLETQDLSQQAASRLQVGGSLAGAPLAIAATLRAGTAGSYTLALERLDWKSAHGTATLHFDGDLLAPVGTVALRVSDLQDFDALLAEPLQGAAAASIVLDRGRNHEHARIALDAERIAFGSTRLTTLQLRGALSDPFHSPRMALQLSAQAPLQGAVVALAAQANGSMDALGLKVEAHAQDAPPATAATSIATGTSTLSLAGSRLQAAGLWDQSRQLLKLNALEAQYREQHLQLAAPAAISFAGGIAIERMHLQWPPAQIQIEGRLTPQLDLRASVHNFNPSVVGVVMPLVQAQGHTDIELDLHGELSRPTGTVTLSAGGISATAGAARGLPAAALRVSAKLADGAADVTATLTAGAHMQLRATGTVPLQSSGAMAVRLTGGMELAVLNPMLEASGQRLLGQMSVEAQFSGTRAAPEVHGSLSLTHGDLQDYPRGVHMTDLTVTVDANGSQVLLKQFDAHAGAGTLSATGSINLGAAGMPLQLELTAANAEPLKTDLLTANLNADLKVAGALLQHDLVISGAVKINKATINIPNALPPDVQTLDVVRPGQGPPPAPPAPLLRRMDLTLNAPRGIFVRGRGLNAELGGTLHIAGSSASPVVSGGFDLLNGIMDIAGATLTFSSGRVSFNGTGLQHKIDPTIDFIAKSALGSAQATLEVSGYADAPVITLSSTNALPPDQILAQLLFGENASQLSALQAAGIASALVTLSGGGGGGLNPLNTVQRALGLNRLVISSNSPQPGTTPTAQSSTGVTIQAGRYVTNRIYVGAKQSTNGLTQAQVQVDITRQLKVQTTLSTGGGTVQGATPENDPGSSVGVSYQFQY